MTPHKQLFRHNPSEGVWGDCGRTVIACLLDLHPSLVPHFWDKGDDGYQKCCEWLNERGFDNFIFPVPGECTKLDVLSIMSIHNPGKLYGLVGKSSNGVNHIVVCRDNKIIHDPSLDDSGIVGPAEDGNWWIELIVRKI